MLRTFFNTIIHYPRHQALICTLELAEFINHTELVLYVKQFLLDYNNFTNHLLTRLKFVITSMDLF